MYLYYLYVVICHNRNADRKGLAALTESNPVRLMHQTPIWYEQRQRGLERQDSPDSALQGVVQDTLQSPVSGCGRYTIASDRQPFFSRDPNSATVGMDD